MVTIIEPSFRTYGCVAPKDQALRRPSRSKRNLGSRQSNPMTPFKMIPEKIQTLYLSYYLYGRPLARKLESFFPPTLSSLNCCNTTCSKTADDIASRRSSKYSESVISQRRRLSLAHDSDTSPTTNEKTTSTDMAVNVSAEVRKLVWTKYEDRDDLLREFSNVFKDNHWVDSAYCPNTGDSEVDYQVKCGLKYLQGTREEFCLITTDNDEPLDIDSLNDLLHEAQAVHQKVSFHVRRHYQDKEEGLRLPQEHLITDLEYSNESNRLFRGVVCNSVRIIRSTIDKNSGELKKRRDQRLKALDKALDRIEKFHKMAIMVSSLSAN